MNTTHCRQPWLEPRPLDKETSEVTMSPPKRTDMYFLTHNRRQTIYQIESVGLRCVEETKILSLDHFTNLNLKKAQNRVTTSCKQKKVERAVKGEWGQDHVSRKITWTSSYNSREI